MPGEFFPTHQYYLGQHAGKRRTGEDWDMMFELIPFCSLSDCILRKFFLNILSVLYDRHCIIYLLLCKITPNSSMYHFLVSVSPDSVWLSWALQFNISYKAAVILRCSHVVAGSIQFTMGFGTESLSPCWLLLRSLSQFLATQVLSMQQLTTWQLS